nr:MAG TPA: hypothetical protein [Caudoviricetes sp.]
MKILLIHYKIHILLWLLKFLIMYRLLIEPLMLIKNILIL